ncbi:hypothetical protein DFH06DRAFT_1177327 [Mycena polygramma]|nr:hypothetical protein DFH06DRAFT_1177327 [Mycena polygramma]
MHSKPAESCSGPSKPKFDAAIREAIEKAINSSHFPLKHQLLSLGLLSCIQAATPNALERYHASGELMLQTCFVSMMFMRPSTERPLGHLGTLKSQVLSHRTIALLMRRGGLEATERISVDGFFIFVGALFWQFNYQVVLLWFKSTFEAIIDASDVAYLGIARLADNCDSRPIELPSSKNMTSAERYKHFSKAVELLSSTPEPQPTPSVHVEAWILRNPVAEAGLEAQPFLAMRKLLETARNFIWDESVAFYNAAFPDGVLALAAEVPAAFTKGWLSAVATEILPRATKRKAAASVDLVEDGVPALCPRARPLPTFSQDPQCWLERYLWALDISHPNTTLVTFNTLVPASFFCLACLNRTSQVINRRLSYFLFLSNVDLYC